MKKLIDILENVDYELVKGSIEVDIKDIKDNSQKVEDGDLFIALVGTTADSHKFIPSAIKQGAKVIVIERDVEIDEDVTVIKVKSSRKALAYMSASYFDYPAKKLTTVGITGTCGKTSTSYIIKSMLEEFGDKVGLIGTICALIGDEKIETHNTTPNSYEVQKLFSQMVEAGCKYAVMEVSSQGLKLDRVAGINFDYGVFTNLSVDHIGPNEHESFEEYMYCKSLLFKQCKVGIINTDSDKWEKVTKDHTCSIVKYALNNDDADLKASNIKFIMEDDFFGVQFDVSGKINDTFKLDIPGRFSVYNALCAIAVAYELEIDAESMKKALSRVKVIGRMELASSNDKYKLIIDYAHTPDAIEKIMTTIQEITKGNTYVVFGCTGDRDRLKRPIMTEYVANHSKYFVITNDDPHYEDPAQIVDDMTNMLEKDNYEVCLDREEAIIKGIHLLKENDALFILGKGHEEFMIVRDKKIPFNDRKVVEEYISSLKEEN